MSWAAALPIPQTATTEQLYHYIPQRHGGMVYFRYVAVNSLFTGENK
jgi:hypothetical protein